MFRAAHVRKCPVELGIISRMGSASLRGASEQLLKEGQVGEVSREFACAIVRRALSIRSDIRYWDLVSVIQCSASSSLANELDELYDLIDSKLSHLSPKHLLDVLASVTSREDSEMSAAMKKLINSLFNKLIQLSMTSIYIDEYIALLRVISRSGVVRNQDLLNALSDAILVNDSLLSQIKILHCCEIIGCLGYVGYLRIDIHG
jgi:hypothetical protein